MLEFLDRPVITLDPQHAFVVIGLRLWVAAGLSGRCALADLACFSRRRGQYGALYPAHSFYYWTTEHARRRLCLGCPCCGRVGDDEALLLAAVFGADDARTAALADVIAPIALRSGVRLARALRANLRAEDMSGRDV
jgi:hypothetical protein